jgi:GTP-binding protein
MIDSAVIKVRAGNGGNGITSFRREAFVPRGGPAGGDGGKGGDVILSASTSVNTLLRFQKERWLEAESGDKGGPSNKTGKSAEDRVVQVPVGTEVWDITRGEPGFLIGDLVAPGAQLIVARGGAGGLGNARFAAATNQAPLLAEAGELGEEKTLRLSMKLLADIGLVGMPNAGKSSILAAISAARPKIANYPFTTLEPVLGVVYHQLDAFVVVDIPGLIEGAHRGVGLGDEFLKHIERTRVLAHVVDGSEPGAAVRVRTINEELRQFNPDLAKRPQVVVVNKLDLIEEAGTRSQVERELRAELGPDVKLLFISAVTRAGIDTLIVEMHRALQYVPRTFAAGDGAVDSGTVLRPAPVGAVKAVEMVDDGEFRIVHPRALRLARGSNLDDWQVLVQFQRKLGDLGVTRELEKAGIRPGDTVIVGDREFEWD